MSERTPLKAVPGLKRNIERLPSPPSKPSGTARGTAPSAADEPTGSVPVAATPPETPARASRRARASKAAATTRAISVSLPLSVASKLREHARATRQTQVDVIFDAFNATRHRLADVLRTDETDTGEDLFRRTPKRDRFEDEPRVTVSLRILSDNLDIVDDLVSQSGAGSRSRLLTQVLRDHLN